MLQALDCLAQKGITHRNIKPENILYSPTRGGGYTYHLTDFGAFNFVSTGEYSSSTPLFMAPEIQLNNKTLSTLKMDVWSLFVTIVYAINVDGFRDKYFYSCDSGAVLQGAAERLPALSRMAIFDAEQRASAAEIRDSVFDEQGRPVEGIRSIA